MNDKIWIDDFDILIKNDKLFTFFPNKNMSEIEKVNSISRFSIYLGIILYLIKNNISFLYIPVVTFCIVYFLYEVNNRNKLIENISDTDIQYGKNILNFNKPTINNQFSNLKVTDYGKKIIKPALKGKRAKKKRRKIIEKIFMDVDDLYNREISSRNFYTMPVTTIPNDRKKFAKWCYEQKNQCKEKGLGCNIK